MRANWADPTKSAYKAINNPFHFQSTTLAPPGIKCLMHIKLNRMQPWRVHAETLFYIGPALKHDQCYKVVMQKPRCQENHRYNLISTSHKATSSITDFLLLTNKHLQNTITNHLVPEATTEEKAIIILCYLLTPPDHNKETPLNTSPLPGTMKHTSNNTNQTLTPHIKT